MHCTHRRLNEPHQLESWKIREGASLTEIQNAPLAESLSFQSKTQYGSTILELASGAKVYSDEDAQSLNAISLSSR
jgi:hypothetical protein